MKQLSNVLRLEKDHVIIDCCPRTTLDLPIDTPLIKEQYDKKTGFYRKERGKYTLYLNISFLINLTDENNSFIVTCNECGTKYEITKNDVLGWFDEIGLS
ncbi:MAG TPA: hypothetical protein P5277_02695 [Candidatus Paceibacterota bacterium]|nr:hypothetical protein [Candidatus Paceibacterota bacterium]